MSSSGGRLPVPPELLAMPGAAAAAAKEEEVDDEQSLRRHHQGRARSFPAERGQWATSVHCPAGDELLDGVGGPASLEAWRAALAEAVPDGVEVHAIESPHLSLSRTVVLRHHQIGHFADALRDALAASACCAVGCDRLVALGNDEGTRTFFALRLAGHCEPACRQLVARVDSAMRLFGLPQYYANPLMHVSLMWALGDLTACRPVLQTLDRISEGLDAGRVGFLADQVVLRSGNKEFIFGLS